MRRLIQLRLGGAQKDSESGIAILEFTICIIFVFLVIGAIFDLGLGLYEYTYLHYTTTRTAREIAAQLATTKDCNVIDLYLQTTAHGEMSDAFAAGASARWDYCFVSVGSTSCLGPGANPRYKSFRVTGTMPLTCFFLCSVLPNDWHATTTITANVENPQLSACPAGGWPN